MKVVLDHAIQLFGRLSIAGLAVVAGWLHILPPEAVASIMTAAALWAFQQHRRDDANGGN